MIEKTDTEMRKAAPVEQRVALTLWFFVTNADYRTTGHLFGVSKSTACHKYKSVRCYCESSKYVQVLSGDQLENVVEGFQDELGFPQCAGVVDGIRIPSVSLSVPPTTTTERVGTQSSCKEWWTLVDSLRRCTLGGLEGYMMQGCLVIVQRGQDCTLFPYCKVTINLCKINSIACIGT